MSTGVLEGLMCFLISLSCLTSCCQTSRGFRCNGEQHFSYNTPPQDYGFRYQKNNVSREDKSSEVDEDNKSSEGTYLMEDNEHIETSIKDSPILVGEDIIREEIECSICLEKYILGDHLRLLTCGHYYHMNCYNNWVCNRKDKRCPVCQTIVE